VYSYTRIEKGAIILRSYYKRPKIRRNQDLEALSKYKYETIADKADVVDTLVDVDDTSNVDSIDVVGESKGTPDPEVDRSEGYYYSYNIIDGELIAK